MESQGKIADEPVMYIIINNDLKMSKGKIAGQACHVACDTVIDIELSVANSEIYEAYDKWKKEVKAKIVLKATEKELLDFIANYSDKTKSMWCNHIRDFGRTQIKHDSLTAIAFNPIWKSQTPDIFKKMKLL